MRTFILGHSFVRRKKNWIRVHGRVIRYGYLITNQHDLGDRDVQQVYHLDMHAVEWISPDVILLQLVWNDINARPWPQMSWWSWKGWLSCWGRTLRVHHRYGFCRRRPRRNGLTNFSLTIWCFNQGIKVNFLFPSILYEETLTKINLFLKCCKPVSITVICSLLAGTVMYLLPSCSGCYSDRFFCRLTIANDPTIQVKRLFRRLPND